MTDTLSAISALTPIGAIIILAGLAATILTQIAKQPGWTAQHRQLVALVISITLGIAAYAVSGIAVGIPQGAVDAISTGVLIIAGVALAARAMYSVVGHVVPDGTPDPPASQVPSVIGTPGAAPERIAGAERGRHADRDGTMDGRDAPPGS